MVYPAPRGLAALGVILSLRTGGRTNPLSPRVFIDVMIRRLAIGSLALMLSAAKRITNEAPSVNDGAPPRVMRNGRDTPKAAISTFS